MLEERLFVHVGDEVSLDPGGQPNGLAELLGAISGGRTQIEPRLRAFLQWIDHVAARALAR